MRQSERGHPADADIELVNHPREGRVLVWIERADIGARTEPVEAYVEGEGAGTLTFNLDLGEEGLPSGGYRLVVLLGEEGRFETPSARDEGPVPPGRPWSWPRRGEVMENAHELPVCDLPLTPGALSSWPAASG